jgi:ribosomal protein S27E
MSSDDQTSDQPTYRQPGGAWWQVTCPNCKTPEVLYAAVGCKLTVPSDGPAKLQLTAKALAVEHDCHQLRLDIATGLLVADAD